METKYNQIVIEKVANGFIIAVQTKEKTSGLFGGTVQVSKEHYVAKDVKEVKDIVSNFAKELITAQESLNLLSEDGEEDEEDNNE